MSEKKEEKKSKEEKPATKLEQKMKWRQENPSSEAENVLFRVRKKASRY